MFWDFRMSPGERENWKRSAGRKLEPDFTP